VWLPTAHGSIDLALGLIALIAIPLLDFPDELVSRARELIQVVIGQLAPLLLSPAFKLLPIAFDLIPVHAHTSFLGFRFRARATGSKAQTASRWTAEFAMGLSSV
jgi:hypothetical protein